MGSCTYGGFALAIATSPVDPGIVRNHDQGRSELTVRRFSRVSHHLSTPRSDAEFARKCRERMPDALIQYDPMLTLWQEKMAANSWLHSLEAEYLLFREK